MRHILALVFILTGSPSWAGEAEAASPLVIGANAAGGLGARLQFNRIETFGAWERSNADATQGWTGTLYWGARADGVWSSQQDARNRAEASLELGFGNDFETARAIHGLTFAFDFKGQSGTFDAADGTSQSLNEYLYGPKVVYRLSWTTLSDFLQKYGNSLGEAPALTAGFYRKGGRTEALVLPERLRADELYAQFRFTTPVLPLPGSSRAGQAVVLSLLLQATRPLQGLNRSTAHFVDATLTLNSGGTTRPAISYRSGEKDGLKYDRQLLFGLLWDLRAR